MSRHNDWIREISDISSIPFSVEFARSVTYQITKKYWELNTSAQLINLRETPNIGCLDLDERITSCCQRIGMQLRSDDILTASYKIGQFYTALLPKSYRSKHGIYFTPPSLTNRLLDMVETQGIDWIDATVLDPACGGGAFLAPVAQRKIQSLKGSNPLEVYDILSKSIRGYEVDSFSAWMSQVFIDLIAFDLCEKVKKPLPWLVDIHDTLSIQTDYKRFDLVIGNPPYSKIKLTSTIRNQYKRSLFGHANLYSLFTEQSLNFCETGGVIALVTPTSFLAGQYFKKLRSLLAEETTPTMIDFISDREGVFENVLQETLLAVYSKSKKGSPNVVHQLKYHSEGELSITDLGSFIIPKNKSNPWIMPRESKQVRLIQNLSKIPYRLSHYGFKVRTGPLVWNRHKSQLSEGPGKNRYPLIWAEAVTNDGRFVFRSEKKNHQPFFEIQGAKDNWLMTDYKCVLLQRTTSKEQEKRLIATELPESFIKKHSAVVVENHLNMIYPVKQLQVVEPLHCSMRALTAILNSRTVDQVFRCISGSVAVSAYELEVLPLPSPETIEQLDSLINLDASANAIESLLEQEYYHEYTSAVA